MARQTTRRIVLASMGLWLASEPGRALAAPRLPATAMTVLEQDGRSLRQWLHRELPPLANQALWAGGADRMQLRWDVHLPPKEDEDEDAEEDAGDESPRDEEQTPGDDDEEEKSNPPEEDEKADAEDADEDEPDERIVSLGSWPLPGKSALAKAIASLAPDAPPLLPGRPTHERPLRRPTTPLWLSTTFVLQRGKSSLALGTWLVPPPLMRRLAQTKGAPFRIRWSAQVRGRRRLAEAPLGEHDAFARVPY